ncbi:hypothetical protein [Shewanella algae]|uniref:hypothetical protein n=2 Tax=Shewanella algae TaxID=38313 RepID=UPI001C8FE48B|nr:hypothetical protein [Shewanella algae]
MCNDGVTPCTFLGYEFQNDSINYFVSVFGELSVTNQHGELILEQSGQWLDLHTHQQIQIHYQT